MKQQFIVRVINSVYENTILKYYHSNDEEAMFEWRKLVKVYTKCEGYQVTLTSEYVKC